MTSSLRDKVVVVTGASAGVGRATARAFADEGAKVALVARGSDRLEAARAELERVGTPVVALPTDVAEADEVEAAASMAEQELGAIDIWVNAAMATFLAPLKDVPSDDFRRATEVTYLGFVYGTMAALRRMLPRNRGHIVQVGSALAYRGIPLQTAYCGAKHAIQGFTESLRCELLHDKSNVKISMVQLPALNTPQFHWAKTTLPMHPQPVPPIYQPEVAARAIVWVAKHYRAEAYVGLSTALTILADKAAPRLLDLYLARSGYKSQQASQPLEPERKDNLWESVPGEFAARGEFDDKAHEQSVQWWLVTHRSLVAALGLGCAALIASLLPRRNERSHGLPRAGDRSPHR